MERIEQIKVVAKNYFDNGTLILSNRYSLPLWSDYPEQKRYRDNSTNILDIFVGNMNYQTQFNSNGTITAVPVVVLYHKIDYKNNSSDITSKWTKHSTIEVNLFDIEIIYV
jgi:hypothetical protein